MRLKRTKLRDAIAFALVVGTSGFAASALAQETATEQSQQGQEEATQLDTIVVTGTRIQSQAITATSPVAEIGQEEFKATGATRVDDLVNQMPQLAPYFDSFANNGATGYPTADLRGLGTNRTLVLVNGQRLQPGTAFARDLSQVPAGLVKRVDILTGGASAVYGADAVAGVVNFILDDEFEGFQVNVGYSAYQHENDNSYIRPLLNARNFAFPDGDSGFDGKSRNIDLIWGSSFADGAGHASAWLTWRRNDPLYQGQRDYSSCALNAAGTACGGSATAAKPNFFVIGSGYVGFANIRNSDGRWLRGTGELYNYAPPNFYQRPEDRLNFGSTIKFEVNEHFRPYLEAMYTNRTSAIQIAESGTFFADALDLNCSDPLLRTMCADLGINPANPVTVYVGKRNVEGGPRHFETKDSSYRVVTGSEGSISDYWSYNVAALFGRTNSTTVGTNDFLSNRIVDALLGCPTGSFSGCIPYNVWVPNGVTREAAQKLAGTSMGVTETKLTGINGYVTGDLGFGLPSAGGDTIALVAGAEWREEEFSFTPDNDSQAGNFAGAGGPSLPLSGQTEVSEVFLEAAVPLLKDVGIIDRFHVDLGYRRSDYDRSGTANTYKVAFGGEFLENYRIRGGYNRAIRAPNIGELFAQQQIALFNGTDPTPEFTLAQCQRTGVTAGQYGSIPASPADQYNQFTGGNPDLRPEQADTYTLGFAATPIEDLEIAVDYFDIKLEERIGTIGANTILRFCGQTGDPFLCSKVKRNPATGDLWIGDNPATAGHVVNLTSNFGNLRVRGIDLNLRYGWDMFGGRATASLVGTRELESRVEPLPGVNDAAAYDCTGLINVSCQNPKWRHIANFRYARDWWSVNLRWRYYGSMDYINTDGTRGTQDRILVNAGNKLKAYNWFDLSGTVQIGEMADFTIGVNNILDKEPPMVGTPLALNANAPGGYDQAGRFIFTSLTLKF
ncbi:TonB-dependent receptor domain-containing protein [Vulcaniibacterium gelatinicum]|uniref:TonB-dependent receptor domain-containing protein n=1 Tax=Vulcaniibacterium gelatinicum TaxID=2598725 RepID=UPI0011C81D8B|nr:TonB-dependent receptor [Vulcaniibacterium gelatinicum]